MDREKTLDRCLDLLQEGGSVEQCLRLYPDSADELEPLLRVAGELYQLPRPEPRVGAARTALLQSGRALQGRSDVPGQRARPPRRRWPARLGVLRWAAAAAILMLTFGVGTASARSVPGDLLYPLKLVTEKATFALTTRPDRRAELRLSFADSRLDELVRTAQAEGRIDPILLKRALNEATLALEDATPASDERYQQLLVRADAFNAYQKRVFERLRPTLAPEDSELVSRAISVCEARERWMRRSWDGPDERQRGTAGTVSRGQRSKRTRCWDSDCRW